MNRSDPAVRRQLAGFALAAALLVAAGVLVSPEAVLRRLGSVADDPVRFAVLLAALHLVRPFLAWPVTLLAVVVGYGYGVALGLPVAIAGTVCTSTIPYLFARYLRGGGGLLGWLGDSGRALFDATGSTRGVVSARLMPIPSDVASYAAGVSGVALRPFVVGTAVGELPWMTVAVLAGDSMATLSAAGLEAIGPQLIVAAALAAVLLLAGPLYRGRASN